MSHAACFSSCRLVLMFERYSEFILHFPGARWARIAVGILAFSVDFSFWQSSARLAVIRTMLQCLGFGSLRDFTDYDMSQSPNKSPEPTAVGAVQFRCRGSRRESAVAQLFSLGIIHTLMKYTTVRGDLAAAVDGDCTGRVGQVEFALGGRDRLAVQAGSESDRAAARQTVRIGDGLAEAGQAVVGLTTLAAVVTTRLGDWRSRR